MSHLFDPHVVYGYLFMGCITRVHLACIAFGYFDLCLKKKPYILNLNDCYEHLSSHLSVDYYSGLQLLEGFTGGRCHDISKSAAGRDNLQKGGRVESRGNAIFCSLQLIFFFYFLMVFTWAQAKNGECYVGFCCVVFFFPSLLLLC